jgi:CBS domain-containing protein
MLVKEIMQTSPVTCAPESDLNAVVMLMRERDCGFVPVVESHGLLAGVITDRDVCIALAATRRSLDRVSARETMSRPVFSCLPDDNVRAALERMAQHHVRRLPVLSASGHLEGVLSVDDIVQAPHQRNGPDTDDIIGSLRRIYARPAPQA